MKIPHLTIRATLLIIIGLLNALIAVLIGNGLYVSWNKYIQAQAIIRGSDVINALYEANKSLSIERGASLAILYADAESAQVLQEDILKNRQDADRALDAALPAFGQDGSSALLTALTQVNANRNALKELRSELDAMIRKPTDQRDRSVSARIFDVTTNLITNIQESILVYSRPFRDLEGIVAQQMRFKYFVWQLAEYSGEEYALIGKIIAEDAWPTQEQQENLMLLRGRIQYGWDIVQRYAQSDPFADKLLPLMEEAQTHYALTFGEIHDLFFTFQALPKDASFPLTTELWLGMAGQAVDSLLALQEEVLKETQLHVQALKENVKDEIMISLIMLVLAVSLSIYCWSVIVFRVTGPVNTMVEALFNASHNDGQDMPKNLKQQDEIGKLVRVLEVFQDNTRKIKQTNEELERFAYIAAHDLKSPLRAVDNLSQWLEEDLEPILQDTDKEHMNELRKRVRLMDKLLDDTLEYARIGAADSKASDMRTGAALIDEIRSLLTMPKNFVIKTDDSLARVLLPKMPLQQVLHNLISNAIKHHDRDDGIVEISLQDLGSNYLFSVRDDGPGIAPQYHQKIFEMFQTLAHDKSKGRGMGLAMVRKIVTTQGGDITVESAPGKGSTFKFTWPKVPVDQEGRDDHEQLYA
ncbi:MAG TPA: ATP-binding protein [Alphaproteobacteria bacterium]